MLVQNLSFSLPEDAKVTWTYSILHICKPPTYVHTLRYVHHVCGTVWVLMSSQII